MKVNFHCSHLLTPKNHLKFPSSPSIKPRPEWFAFRALDYGYTRLYAHNGTHLEIEQVKQ